MDGKGGFGGEEGSLGGASGGGASGGEEMCMAGAEHRRAREQSCEHKANVKTMDSKGRYIKSLTTKQVLQFSNALLQY